MAVMCERVTLPPISSLDFAFNTDSNENTRAPTQRNSDTSHSPRGYTTPPAPHAPYERSSWDAARPTTTGRPFLTTEHYQDARQRPSAYEYRTFPSPPLPGSLSRRSSPPTADRPLTAPASSFGGPGLADVHQHRTSHVRTASQLSSKSADTWSEYDSEQRDSPVEARLRSLSPGGTRFAHVPPPLTPMANAFNPEVRFVHSSPSDVKSRPHTSASRPTTSAGRLSKASAAKKRKVDDREPMSEDELAGDLEGDSPDSHQKGEGDDKRKFKKMMNVRHYRAQTKDALQSLRDVLPESMRPQERQARSFTVVNAVKHIENITGQLHKLQRENMDQAERLYRADVRERELLDRVSTLQQALGQSGGRTFSSFEERVPATQQAGDRA
ncbi:hypothetical protein PENSPDRAFT_651564 [Peniophora sp. CONT]|nr:hypothetical protein PENSPDRAFT_651564 [Peniophora sp. CONT]